MMIELIVLLFNDIQRLNLNERIHLSASLDVSEWDHFLIFLSGLYVECHYGIFLLKELKNIQIDSIENRYIGRLVASKHIDHSELLQDKIAQSGLHYQFEKQIFVIPLQK